MSIFDRLAASSPLNRLAAVVTSSGEDCPIEGKPDALEWDAPLLVQNPFRASGPEEINLSARKSGRLTVIGKAIYYNAKWLCKCACGKYVLRTAKAIKKQDRQNDDCCSRCQRLHYIINRSSEEDKKRRKQVGLGW